VAAREVLALDVTIDGTPLAELPHLPVLRAGDTGRHTVALTMRSTRGKVLEEGTLTFSVGFGDGPPPVLEWSSATGATRRLELATGTAVPEDAPSWARTVTMRTALRPLAARDLSVCFAVTSELAQRATARLLAQFRPMLAGRMKHHDVVNAENVRVGGTACSEEDRRNDLYECLLLHVRSYVTKAVRDQGTYDRDLFAYVTGCFKPAAFRALLAYGPRTGHQDETGRSQNVSEAVGALRQHAAIHRITDPVAARSHHAVHWVLARRFSAELANGEMTLADLEAMWAQGDLPEGVRVPDAAAWELAVGHEACHVPFDAASDDDDAVLGEVLGADVVPLPGGSARRPARLTDADLDLLVDPSDDAVETCGFFAITSAVATRLAEEEPELWLRAVGDGRGAARLVRRVVAPFASGPSGADAAARLHDSCTVGRRWLVGNDLFEAWRSGGRDTPA
jgi:hypothetical protein